MQWLAENPLPIWVAGIVALTMALVAYQQTRSPTAVVAGLIIILVTAALLLTEWLIETPRETVQRTLYALADTVEANDVPGTLALLAPDADRQLRTDIESLMPMVKIERLRILGTPQIDVYLDHQPMSATAQFRGFILATNKGNGMKGGAEDEITLSFMREGDRWLAQGYTSKRNWGRAVGRR